MASSSSSSSANPALARTRSLRAPPTTTGSLKLSSALAPPTGSGPSHVSLFLTNLRLLDLDRRDDWPGITTSVLTSKDAKKRIQCVEWGLYHLFALWDPEETRNVRSYKLQPFFPPLEPLQSLNLRAALYRCLDQAKKNGALGRDTVLRKTMLDECKGDRLEEVLSVFSNAVLQMTTHKKNPEGNAIAQRLASENFSYSGERTGLSSLILAHKVSLGKHLRDKNSARAQYQDFSELLDLHHRRATRRHEQLKESIDQKASDVEISRREITDVHEKFQKNWSGNSEWVESILYGDCTDSRGGLLASNFNQVWSHVEKGTIGDLEGKRHVGLLEQLDARVKDQAARLARWQDFGKTLSKKDTSPVKKDRPALKEVQAIDLRFDRHQILQTRGPVEVSEPSKLQDEYARLIGNMKAELNDVDKPKQKSSSQLANFSLPADDRESAPPSPVLSASPSPASPSPAPSKEDFMESEDDWASASSEVEGTSPGFNATNSTSRTPRSGSFQESTAITAPESTAKKSSPVELTESEDEDTIHAASTPRPLPVRQRQRTPSKTLSPKPIPSDFEAGEAPKDFVPQPAQEARRMSPTSIPSLDPEADLMADEILNSMAAASPSPSKPRHTLSLAERTRLSMARSSHSQYSDLHEDYDLQDLPRLALKSMKSSPLKTPDEVDPHADLIERTRRSMAGYEAAQKKAHVERRRSVKAAAKKERESSYFPKIQETIVEDLDHSVLIEGEPDYESVFKSRPKIATSPAISPTKSWNEQDLEE
ncbi:hypothetical protein PVAG01_01981 [Phlyctema vagabunda]|uniref:HAUS augmin-like complex subunit 6 N-terminal domain-containing protein n=1 Tax=Phlyctema vagabunda TaxID=108571 RepID=A0ABR4PYM8_9HELO